MEELVGLAMLRRVRSKANRSLKVLEKGRGVRAAVPDVFRGRTADVAAAVPERLTNLYSTSEQL